MATERVTVRVDGRRLQLSNLDKILYPEPGFAKRDVLDYYARIAPLMLPHLRRRPVTFRRYPDGVRGEAFYEKDAGRRAPDWIKTARVASHRADEGSNLYPMLDGVPSLVWAANLAALELHVPQWTVGPKDARRNPDLLVFDLDPGEPATVVECCRVAEWLSDALTADGLAVFAKTSGSKGLQLYSAIRTRRPEAPSEYAEALARRLAEEHPDLVVARMAKALRPGKVFIDWSQNNPSKTTVAPYSLRGKEFPTVSTPVTWEEVHDCEMVDDLVFTAADVLERAESLGDLFAELPAHRAALPKVNRRPVRASGK